MSLDAVLDAQRRDASARFMEAANRLPTLWELGSEWTALLSLLEDPEQDPAEVDAALAAVAGDIKQKAYGLAVVLQSLKGLAEFQKAESDRLAAKAKANLGHAERLRGYALRCMRAIGTERIETGAFTLAIRQNPPSVEVLDASVVPSDFNRTKIIVEVDKTRVKDHWKATGEVVPGVSIVRTERLAIS